MKDFFGKLERIFLVLFLLLIPTQLGMHFWPEWSYVMGMRVDYLSPTLYITDILWLLIFLICQIKTPPVCKADHLPLTGELLKWKYLVFLLFIGLNIFLAQNHWVAGYRWLRVFQIGWMVGYLRKPTLPSLEKGGLKQYLHWIIPCWIVFESLLGLAQVANGGSLNGIFYWLGERRFDFNTIGIAQISFLGEGFVRAYGTFSHPNSLAGFLLVGLMVWKSLGVVETRHGASLQRVIYWVVVWLGVLGIVLSGSRVVWGLALANLLMQAQCHQKYQFRKFTAPVLIGLIVFSFLAYRNNWIGGWDRNGFEKRMDLNVSALKMIKDNPLFGVGAGNFLVKLPEYQKQGGIFWLQPVHNIPLLILSEVGVIGIIILISNFQFIPTSLDVAKLRISNTKSTPTPPLRKGGEKIRWFFKNRYWWVWGVILVTSMFDHYWVTLPQNMWLLGIVISLSKFKNCSVPQGDSLCRAHPFGNAPRILRA